jgi:hypothetical protein
MKKRFCGAVLSLVWILCCLEVRGASPNIALHSRSVIWQPGISLELQTNISQATAGVPVAALVNFQNPLTLDNHQLLQASGVQLEDYLEETAYVAVILSRAFVTNPTVSSLVFAAESLRPSDKLQVPTNTNELSSFSYDPAANTLTLLVGFWSSVEANTVVQALGTLGFNGAHYGADNSWTVVIPVDPGAGFAQTLTNIASLPSVKFVQEGPEPFLPLNDKGRTAANTGPAQNFILTGPTASTPVTSSNPAYNRMSGTNIRIAICDEGVAENHGDFKNVSSHPTDFRGQAVGSRIAKSRAASSFHGTHTASVAAGNGIQSAYNWFTAFQLRGHAPRAWIGDYPHFGGDANLHYAALVTDPMPMHLCNHSYVQSIKTFYLSATASLDAMLNGTGKNSSGSLIPARPSVWGIGNNCQTPQYGTVVGYYSAFTSAKNTISVGSIDAATGRRSRFSSLGPTLDGRIKPDVVAPGNLAWNIPDGILAAVDLGPTSGQGYGGASGTSVAAPVVSGIIALMMQQYAQSCLSCADLPPAMYKAILIHTATDLEKLSKLSPEDLPNPDHVFAGAAGAATIYHAGPDFATGYGLVNAEAAREKITQSNHRIQATIATTGSSQSWCIEVPALPPGTVAEPLKVVIAWDDPPASNFGNLTAKKLVNDLDLRLIAPSGGTVQPWVLTPPPVGPTPGSALNPIPPAAITAAIQGPDHLNNVEMVTVANPAAGVWRATVSGYNIPFAPGQAYSLVSSHRITFCFSPPHITRYREKKANICDFVPELCDLAFFAVPALEPVAKGVRVPMRTPIPIESICKYVANCPSCEGPAWQFCAGFKWRIGKLPRDIRVVLFNDAGEVLDEVASGDGKTSLTVPNHPQNSRLFLLAFHKTRKGTSSFLDLGLEIESTPPTKG